MGIVLEYYWIKNEGEYNKKSIILYIFGGCRYRFNFHLNFHAKMGITNVTALFGVAPSSIDLSENTAASDKEAIITLIVIAAVAIALRFYARTIQRQKPYMDDWIITICLV